MLAHWAEQEEARRSKQERRQARIKQARKKTRKNKASKKEDKKDEDIVLDLSNMGENGSIEDIAEWSNEWNDDGEDILADSVEQTERQLTYQEQLGGSAAASEPGRFQFNLNPYVDRVSESMGVRERHYMANLRQRGQFITRQNLNAELRDAVYEALQILIRREGIPDRDHVYFNLASNRINHVYGYRRLPASEWLAGSSRVDGILDQMARVLNSNESFEMDDTFQLSFTHVRAPPRGSGKRKLKPGYSNPVTHKRLKHSVVTVKNKDDLCCARAIVTAKAKVDNHPNWHGFQKGTKIQYEQALLLHHEADVPFGPCGYEELQKFSRAPSLYEYQLLLVDETRGYRVLTFGPPQDKKLVLVYNGNHYDVITSLPGYFVNSYFCWRCLKPYNDEGRHACTNNSDHCPACLQNRCSDYMEAKCRRQRASLLCGSCKRLFHGDTCLQQHLTQSYNGKAADVQNVSVCTHRRKCLECMKLLVDLKEQKEHKCGYVECRSCREYVEVATHKCFVQVAKSPQEEKEEKKKKKKAKRGAAAGLATLEANDEGMDIEQDDDDKPPLHVFFDIEAMQDTGRHVPNLLIAETENDDSPERFKGEHCVRDFLEWLDTLTEGDTRPVTVIAHNFQGYDGYFVVDEYHRQNRIINQVRNGGKLMQVTFDKIRFIDSLSFFQMPLSAFPKTFGLVELKKGFFRHFINTPENQDYVGHIPDKQHYMPETMSVGGRKDFETWHDEQVAMNVEFDFQKELIEYCESDVKLLKEGCLTFKRLFEKQSEFNPFDNMTIASACNRDLRQNRMAPNTIASEPLHGWRMKTNHSKVSLEWLHWKEHCLLESPDDLHHESVGIRIQHAANQGEYRIPNSRYTVDGYDEETNTVYEFEGCFWHGCPECYPNRTEFHKRLEDRCADDVYQCTQKKIQFLKDKGYNVVTVWECEWERMKKEKEEIKAFVNNLDIVEPLNPRDAFCGGRTNAVKLYHQADEENEEEIKYYDYTSLYPYVNKNSTYPIGHPDIIFQPGHTDISRFFGIAKCTVLPPYGLYHPVLPLRQNDKLTFPLCRTCVEEEMAKPMLDRTFVCSHTVEQRKITGTWCTPELEVAVEKGYKILRIHEAWNFPERQEGLFANYVNTWLKIKEEASGWPSHVGDDPEKQRQYVEDYFAREGIRLDPSNIKKNPGLRTLAKLMLNSMWGKFGQKPNKTQVREFDDPVSFSEFHESDKYDIRYVSVLTEQRVEIHFKHKLEDDPVSPNLNIFVAAFTTCWARLRLYEALDLLQERVLYFDTDSVVFVTRPGEQNPSLGDYLGDFKDELSTGDYIIEFASGGPKNYGYLTKNGKEECKVRGISLNSEGSKQLNYRVLRQNVIDDIQQPLQSGVRQTDVVKPYHIVRNAKQYAIETVPQTKKYQMVFGKRVIDTALFYTYPYGYSQLDPRPEAEAQELMDSAELNEQDKRNIEVLIDL
ncbi:hypothetical protein ACROYT_G004941 [Oculina patagonica]